MLVARDHERLARRLSEFLERGRSHRTSTLSALLRNHFLDFNRVGVVGGMVRDFARGGAAAFRSDVDLVIEASVPDVARLASQLDAIPNRFGGYGWSCGGWKVDFWALETTWAAREGHVKVKRLEDVTRCVFFDWDAAAYELKTHKLICAPDYLDLLAGRRMDLILTSTPSIEGNLIRALRRISFWHVAPGPRLLHFIEEHLTEERFTMIAATEKRLYARRVTSEFPSVVDLRRRVEKVSILGEAASPRLKQMDLFEA